MVAKFAPSLLGAVALLIVGWLVAKGLAALVGAALRKTSIDNRIAASITGREDVNVERSARQVVFWLIMILVLIGVLQVLGLTLATGPLHEMLTTVFEFIPRLAAAAVLLVAAWAIATILRLLVRKGVAATGLERRLQGAGEAPDVPVTNAIAEAVYWLVLLLFLPAILDALALQGLLEPVQAMLGKVLAFLPNLLTAGIVLLVGWFLARIIQRIVKSLLIAVGADRLAERLGLARALGDQGLSGVVGMIAYVLFLIPVLIAALNALNLEPITVPASNMLNMVLSAIPSIFAAVLLLAIAYGVGSIISKLMANLLAGAGFDSLIAKFGVKEGAQTGRRGSEIVGTLILVAVMLFAGIEALRLVGFHAIADLVAGFLVFAGHVALGLIIFAVGLYLANLAARAIRESGTGQAALLATAARISILVLAAAVGLREMGVGADIVRLAFGLLVGAVAVATAVAFGIGGRNLAQRKLEQWSQDVEDRTSRS
jgi:hypothetical protein